MEQQTKLIEVASPIEKQRIFLHDFLQIMWKKKLKPGWVFFKFADEFGLTLPVSLERGVST